MRERGSDCPTLKGKHRKDNNCCIESFQMSFKCMRLTAVDALVQGIVYLNRNGNCCGKLLREPRDACAVLIKKVLLLVFVVSVTASLLRLGALVRDNLQMGVFFLA